VEKNQQHSPDSPFQRFQKLAKALFAVPKKEADEKATDYRRNRRKRPSSKKIASMP
jgi:hypothetical protein